MNQLSFEEFQKEVEQKICSYLPPDVEYETDLNHVEKNNVTLTALQIRKSGEQSCPVFYLEPYYKEFQNGESLINICKTIANIYKQIGIPDFALKEILDYNAIKERLEVKLVSTEKNEAYLSRGLYRINEIGAEIININLGIYMDGQMTIRVTKELLEQYSVSSDVLFQQARENTIKRYPLEIYTLSDAVHDIVGDERQMPSLKTQIYVVSNQETINGATVILYPDALRQIAERVGGDYYILPSSIHEVMAISKQCGMTESELRAMVRQVNRWSVDPRERLSNEVFSYNSKDNTLHKCVIKEREKER